MRRVGKYGVWACWGRRMGCERYAYGLFWLYEAASGKDGQVEGLTRSSMKSDELDVASSDNRFEQVSELTGVEVLRADDTERTLTLMRLKGTTKTVTL